MLTFFAFLILTPIVCLGIIFLFAQVIIFFRKAKLNRDWDSLHKLLPEIIYNQHNGEVFVRNVRNAKYNPAFEFENKVGYQNKRYNLKDLSKLWILVNPYATLQSHVILSFQFGDKITHASFLTLSYELRKTYAEDFSTTQTLYKIFEGYYLLATEEDVFYVRTNIRKNDGDYYLYELNIPKESLDKLFLAFVKRVNSYFSKALKYQFFSRNCLTEIFTVMKEENILKYNYFDYFFVRNLLNKNKELIKSVHKIENTKNLKPDENYSLHLRLSIDRNHLGN